jgi:membrane dipeptidase
MVRSWVSALLLLGACATTAERPVDADQHARMLTLDTHIDTAIHFGRPGWHFGERHDSANDLVQVDLTRMSGGALDGGFFAIYTEQGPLTPAGYTAARAFATRRSDLIDATIARHANRIEPALTAADARGLAARGKLFAFKSIENSYPLGEDLSALSEFKRRGVRLAGPVHSAANQFADAATGAPRWNGLSPLGKRWVREMNRLGLVIDASHASDAAFDQLLDLSTAPILLSHSSPRAMFDHPRNLDDARIRRLAVKGGAICVSTIFLSDMKMGPERARLFAQYERIAELSPADQVKLTQQWRALDRTEPMWAVDFERYMAALLHTIRVAGVDHVCFGADWDGGGGFAGFEGIEAHGKVTERLRAAGYSFGDIEKMWSGNVLRILEAAERGAAAR